MQIPVPIFNFIWISELYTPIICLFARLLYILWKYVVRHSSRNNFLVTFIELIEGNTFWTNVLWHLGIFSSRTQIVLKPCGLPSKLYFFYMNKVGTYDTTVLKGAWVQKLSRDMQCGHKHLQVHGGDQRNCETWFHEKFVWILINTSNVDGFSEMCYRLSHKDLPC